MRARVCVRDAQLAISGPSCDYDAMRAYARHVVAEVLGPSAAGARLERRVVGRACARAPAPRAVRGVHALHGGVRAVRARGA